MYSAMLNLLYIYFFIVILANLNDCGGNNDNYQDWGNLHLQIDFNK